MTRAIRKEFKYKDNVFYENVAVRPKLFEGIPSLKPIPTDGKTIFSFRVDADEISSEDFSEYINIFSKYNDFITVFLCCSEFEKKKDLVLKLKDSGVDIQSHGYYHHVYNDYANNLNNLMKANEFLGSFGIKTEGFAGPMGKYNDALGKALMAIGYKYSSEFSFDYINFPHFPIVKGSVSKVIQLPIFPICPEILFSKGLKVEEVFEYYLEVMKRLKKKNIPIILYAHTDVKYPEVKKLISFLLKVVYEDDDLVKMNMTEYASWYFSAEKHKISQTEDRESSPFVTMKRITKGDDTAIHKISYDDFLFGEIKREGIIKRIKHFIKELVDFEKVTPWNELKDAWWKKIIKVGLRKIIK